MGTWLVLAKGMWKNHVESRGLKSTCVNGMALAFMPLPLLWEHAYPSFLEDKRHMPSQLFQPKASEINLRVNQSLKAYVSQARISRDIYVTTLGTWIMKLLLYIDEVLFVWLIGCLLCNITVTMDIWYRCSHEFFWGSPNYGEISHMLLHWWGKSWVFSMLMGYPFILWPLDSWRKSQIIYSMT